MATPEEYAQWIIDNQSLKGTPEFNTVAKAYEMSKGSNNTSGYKSLVRPTLEGLGMVGGGVLGVGAAPETLGVSAVAGPALGYAFGKRLADIYEGVPPERLGDMPTGIVKDVAHGAALEMGGQAIGPALSAIIPKQANQKALALLEAAGVKASPGQIAGGWAKNLEDKLSGTPVIGDAIKAARNYAQETFNVGAGRRAGYTGDVAGHEMIAEIGDSLGKQFDNLMSKSQANMLDPTFLTNVNNIKSIVSSLPKKESNAFNAILQREIGGRATQGGRVAGEQLQAMESGLGRQVEHFRGSTDGYQRQLGEALEAVKDELHELVQRSNPKYADEINQVRREYANYKRLESAASNPSADKGVFTPFQLHRAIRAGDNSLNHKQFSRGSALMQDYSQAGRDILESKIGSSGTSERLQASNPIAWATGAAIAPLYNNPLTRKIARTPSLLGDIVPIEQRRLILGGLLGD